MPLRFKIVRTLQLRPDGAGAGAVAAWGVERRLSLWVVSAWILGRAPSQSSGGKGRGTGGGAADDVQHALEGDPAGIHVGGLSGSGVQH